MATNATKWKPKAQRILRLGIGGADVEQPRRSLRCKGFTPRGQIVRNKSSSPRQPLRLLVLPLMACVVLALEGCAGLVMGRYIPWPGLAPVLNQDVKYRIPDQYIVAFKPGTDREAFAAAKRNAKELGGTIRHTITSEPMWFSAMMPESAVKAMRRNPGVVYIEADQTGTLSTAQPPNPDVTPPKGLDRTSERLLPLDTKFTYSEDGTGVHVYVLDTGIQTSHAQFAGRALGPHVDCVAQGGNCGPTSASAFDNNGHGTHVAAIIGGATYGIAKNVFIHSVRVSDASAPQASDVAAGIRWVRDNAMHPAVANLSENFFVADQSPSTLTADVNSAIDAGVTVVISAGNYGDQAANHWPGSQVPGAIIVGAVDGGVSDPGMDIQWAQSCYGPSVDIFAPGAGIESAWKGSDTATNTLSGTSMAAAHVSGVAALYLDSSNASSLPSQTPANVKNRIVDCDVNNMCVPNVFGTTPGWAGVKDPSGGPSSPNKLLHWGSRDDGYNDGEPHIKTVNGVHYDFQGAGEYVALRDQDGMEIQTRQAAIATTLNPSPNSYTGLATCVSINAAVAARVGTHRVTYQPNISGEPESSGLELRVDGELVELGPDGLDLGSGGRVVKAATGSIEIDFPNGTILAVTPGWWASQSKWWLNVDVLRTRSDAGLMGAIRPGSWLPALPDGTSPGPMPAALHDRYVALYQKFGNAWRVTDETSLFDYAPGTSTATFTDQSWPPESPPCDVAGTQSAGSTTAPRAGAACSEITDKNRRANCVFDVRATGNPGFAKTYLLSERLHAGSTTITLAGDQDTTQVGEWVTFTAMVASSASANRRRIVPGAVQFNLDGSKVGEPVTLDSKGRATWETSRLKVGRHRVAASYIPKEGSVYLTSRSLELIHMVKRCYCEERNKSWGDRR